MAAKITQLLAELATALIARNPTLTVLTGELALDANNLPPRVVWIPRASSFGPAEKTMRNPRSLATETVSVETHLWGATFDDVESLKEDLVVVLQRTAVGSFTLTSIDRTQPDYLTQGIGMVLTFSVSCPLPDRTFTTVVPIAFTPAAAIAGDGILDSGDPQ